LLVTSSCSFLCHPCGTAARQIAAALGTAGFCVKGTAGFCVKGTAGFCVKSAVGFCVKGAAGFFVKGTAGFCVKGVLCHVSHACQAATVTSALC
jgi:hypothetical protein